MTSTVKVTVAPDRIALGPGDAAEVEVTVQNASQVVEHYGTSIVGLPREDLYDCEPALVRLKPGGSDAVRVQIRLPERAGPRAGGYTLGVLVRSPYQREVSRCAELWLDVQPAPALSMTVQPEVAAGGPTAAYVVNLTNDGNVPLAVHLDGHDPESKATFSFRPPAVEIEPGATARAELVVRAAVPWTGQEIRRTLTLRAVGTDVTLETPATFVQRPTIAGGPLRVAMAAGAVAVLAAATLGGAFLIRSGLSGPPAAPPSSATTTAPPTISSPPTTSSQPTTTSPTATSSPTSPSASPGTATVVDFSRLPNGEPTRDRFIPGDFYAASGISLSTVLDQAPPDCEDATALALRTARPYGSFLTSTRPVGVNLCNTLPVRIQFTSPARSVRLGFTGKGAQYTMAIELSDGNTTTDTAPAQQGSVTTLSYEAPPGLAVAAVIFGHADPSPTSDDPTIIKRIAFTTA